MAKSREELHEVLCNLLGTRNVYYQPPENIKLKYPCVIYDLADIETVKADNIKYLQNRRYEVTIIDEDPDSEFVDILLNIPYCSFDRSYSTEDLNHWVFGLYF